jgi:hypothetical protein
MKVYVNLVCLFLCFVLGSYSNTSIASEEIAKKIRAIIKQQQSQLAKVSKRLARVKSGKYKAAGAEYCQAKINELNIYEKVAVLEEKNGSLEMIKKLRNEKTKCARQASSLYYIMALRKYEYNALEKIEYYQKKYKSKTSGVEKEKLAIEQACKDSAQVWGQLAAKFKSGMSCHEYEKHKLPGTLAAYKIEIAIKKYELARRESLMTEGFKKMSSPELLANFKEIKAKHKESLEQEIAYYEGLAKRRTIDSELALLRVKQYELYEKAKTEKRKAALAAADKKRKACEEAAAKKKKAEASKEAAARKQKEIIAKQEAVKKAAEEAARKKEKETPKKDDGEIDWGEDF